MLELWQNCMFRSPVEKTFCSAFHAAPNIPEDLCSSTQTGWQHRRPQSTDPSQKSMSQSIGISCSISANAAGKAEMRAMEDSGAMKQSGEAVSAMTSLG